MKFYPTISYFGAYVEHVAQAARELGITLLAVNAIAIEDLPPEAFGYVEADRNYTLTLEAASIEERRALIDKLRARVGELWYQAQEREESDQ